MKALGRDPYGCHGEPKTPLDKQFPHLFRGAPGPVTRCPFALLSEPHRWRTRVLNLVRDYRAGALPNDWREVFTAPVVEAIEYTVSESDSATADLLDMD